METEAPIVGYTGECKLEEYISAHIDAESALLRDLYRETNIKLLNPRMASGHIQGQLLRMIVTMIKPKLVLEVGTFTGYATICMASGLPEDGIIHTIETDDELEDFITKGFSRFQYRERIKLHIGNALNIVPSLGHKYDMIFLDGDKREYPQYYTTFMKYLNIGGYIIADNTLWDGHVIDSAYNNDHQTAAVKQFNDMAFNDPCTEVAIIPLRDGLSIIRKIKETTI